MRCWIVLMPVLATACHRSPSVTADNASTAEVAAKVKAAGVAAQLTPGHWDSTVSIDELTVPGLPPGIAEKMKAAMDRSHRTGSCLTPEQAKNPGAGFFGGRDNKACRYDHFRMSGGAVDARMTCQAGGGTSAQIALTGTYTPDSFQMRMVTKSEAGPGQAAGGLGSNMTMTATVDARHAGACTGKEGGGVTRP